MEETEHEALYVLYDVCNKHKFAFILLKQVTEFTGSESIAKQEGDIRVT